MSKAIFVTGTDTEVGKTYIMILLAQYYREKGLDVGVMKPISCGKEEENDGLKLKRILGMSDFLETINPFRLSHPLAPYVALKKEGKRFDLGLVEKSFSILSRFYDLILMEGVGGALVPIEENYLVADLIKDLNIPALIVARSGLGTINHTLLTVEALKKRQIDILGVVLNGFKGELAEEDNPKMIEKFSGLPILAKIKEGQNKYEPIRNLF